MLCRTTSAPLILIALLLLASDVFAQQGRGRGQGFRHGQNDAAFQADRELFQLLLRNRDKIRRSVKNVASGVETVTESDDATIAQAIQKHVASMHGRVKEGRPIHRRDPLFDELFRHANKIEMKVEKTARGTRVVETSDDPDVASLIQAHAKVVSLFVEHGHREVRKNHRLPEKVQRDLRE